MARLAVSLLGSLDIKLDEQSVTTSVTAKARALLAYLAVEANRPHRRETLAALLWPDYPERSARTNLRNTLSNLRKAIGDRDALPPFLLVTRETVQFNAASDCWVDVAAFDDLLAGQAPDIHCLKEAIALYRGPFLQAFSVADSPAFDDWTLGVRQRLAHQFSAALQALTEQHEQHNELEEASEVARRWVALAPWQEQAHQTLMRLLAQSGQRGAALAQYEACRRALREELDVAPGDETRRLYERIRDGELAPPRQTAGLGTISEPRQKMAPPDAFEFSPSSEQVAPPSPPTPLTTARQRAALIEGERRIVTALLADVKGSDALAEQIDTEDWVEIMDRVFQILGAEIYRYGGEVDQFRGDGLVAFFGLPTAHEDDPERAVLAALAMQESTKRYAAELAQRQGIDLSLRVGVNTGEVIAATVGERHHREETAMGRAVALAARMETACEPGTVLVTDGTYRLVAPLFEWQALGEMAVKGVSQPVSVYRPLAVRAIDGKGRGIEGLSSPLVGRDAELRALEEAIERLQSGIGGIVTVVGEAGIGKSRLVTEVHTRTQTTHHESRFTPQWIEGRCLSYATAVAYQIWLDTVRRLLGVAPDASPAALRDALERWVRASCPDCYQDVYPYVARIMSLSLDEETEAMMRGLGAQGVQVSTFRAMETLVERTARQRPLVLVCEDLHWADPTSLELLERLLSLVDRAPLLLLCILRPERRHGCWHVVETAAREYPHRHTDLRLRPLSVAESETLVGNLLRVEDLPGLLRDRVLDHAEGNPFFVEEILRSLIDGGIIVHDEATGRWHARQDMSDISIPDTLHGVLSARIDRLQAETRRVLRLASVIGRVFLYRILAEIAGEEQQLDTRLLALQRQQLIRERARLPELEYIFKHELTREAAYKGLLRRERRAYHRQVAEALERLFLEQADEQAGLLAHHWEQAEEPEKAIQCLLRAGEQARLAYANEEAAGYLRRALALLETLHGDEPLPARAQIGEDLGDILKLIGRPDQARAAYRDALDQTPEGDRIRQARLQRKIGLAWLDPVERLAACDQAEVTLELAPTKTTEWWQEWVNAQLDRAWGYYAQARHKEMAELLEQIRPIVEQSGTPVQRHEFAQSYIGMKWRQERYAVTTEVLTLCRDTVLAARESGDLRRAANATFRLGLSLLWLGEFDEAESAFQEAIALGRRVGDTNVQLLSLTYQTVTCRKRGQILETQRYAAQSLDAATAGQRAAYIAMAQANLAWVAWQGRNLTETQELAQSALALWQEWDAAYPFQWAALYPLIGVALAQDRVSEAISHASALLDPMQQHLPEAMTAALQEAIEAWARDETLAARAYLDRVLTLAQELGYL